MSEYVPMLIVGLNENEEYIHIRNAKNDESYICPCCGAKIKARAMKSNKVQPHFYHSEGSECSEENIAHWIYKNWLFGFGCKFIINKDGVGKEYIVDSIFIEKPHSTKFGLYKPDITVNTTSGDTIYFEIYYSNKKNVDDYCCKWSELGNDVVEVDTRELISSNIKQSTPTFNVIFSNGKYLKLYIKKGKRDIYANTIKAYKDVISKTECENFKKRFEQLDWFWIMLQKYRLQKVGKQEVIEIYSIMDFEDMNNCYDLTRRLKCIDILDEMKMISNDTFKEKVKLLENKMKVNINISKMSPQIYVFTITTAGYVLSEYERFKDVKIKVINDLFNADMLKKLRQEVFIVNEEYIKGKIYYDKVKDILDEENNLIKINAKSSFDIKSYKRHKSSGENIGHCSMGGYNDSNYKYLLDCIKWHNDTINNEIRFHFINNNSVFIKYFDDLNKLVNKYGEHYHLKIEKVSPSYHHRRYELNLIIYYLANEKSSYSNQYISKTNLLDEDIEYISEYSDFLNMLTTRLKVKLDDYVIQHPITINNNILIACKDLNELVGNNKSWEFYYYSYNPSTLNIGIATKDKDVNCKFSRNYLFIRDNILHGDDEFSFDNIDLTKLTVSEISEIFKNRLAFYMNRYINTKREKPRNRFR